MSTLNIDKLNKINNKMSANLKWTKNEELELINNIASGKGLETFAQNHGRSVSAVELRLKKIIYENCINGKSLEHISQLLKINIDKTTQYYYWYKEFKESKDKIKNNNNVNMGAPHILEGGGDQNVFKSAQPAIQSTVQPGVQSMVQPFGQLQNDILNNIEPMKIKNIDAQIEKAFAEPNNLEKIESKLKKLKTENEILKLVVENKELTQKLNQLIDEKKIDPSIKQLIKIVRKSIK